MTENYDTKHPDERMAELWLECLETTDTKGQDREALKQEALRLIDALEHPATKRRNRNFPAWGKAAAAAALLVTISLSAWFFTGKGAGDDEIAYLELTVPYGEKKEITLTDGSKVTLNAGSKFRYPGQFADGERDVYLDGEAFFSVAPDKKKPFKVISGNMAIKVLGTEFNVRTYGEDELASVSVRTGKVQVETGEMMSRLIAGDHITLNNRTKDFRKNTVEIKSITYWIHGGLAFHETPINDVAKELTRIYNHKIRFEKGQTFNNLIIGEHDNKSLESVLKSIEYTSGIKFRKEGEEYVLYKE